MLQPVPPSDPPTEPAAARAKVEWTSIPELARRIGLSKEAVYRLARAGKLPGAVLLGRRYTINYTAFVAASSYAAEPRRPQSYQDQEGENRI